MRKETKKSAGQGLCCAHCADSKFPCVNMEKSMKAEERDKKEDKRK